MKTNAANDASVQHAITQNDKVLQEAQSLWHELCAVLQNRLQLAVLETRRAGESLVTMIIAGVMVALLLIREGGRTVGAGVVASIIE